MAITNTKFNLIQERYAFDYADLNGGSVGNPDMELGRKIFGNANRRFIEIVQLPADTIVEKLTLHEVVESDTGSGVGNVKVGVWAYDYDPIGDIGYYWELNAIASSGIGQVYVGGNETGRTRGDLRFGAGHLDLTHGVHGAVRILGAIDYIPDQSTLLTAGQFQLTVRTRQQII